MAELLEAGGGVDSAATDMGERSRARRRGPRTYVLAGVFAVLLAFAAVLLLPDRRPAATTDDAAYEPFVHDSAVTALTWVKALTEGDDLYVWILLCGPGREKYADASDAQIRADFEHFVGGRLASGEVTHAEVVKGSYHVTMAGTLESGAKVEFMVLVVSEASGFAVCGFRAPSRIP
jgi:hypothetical protein